MFRFLSARKRPASPAGASFRPQLEDLEGRTLPSGMVPTTEVQLVNTGQKVIATDSQLVTTDIKQLVQTEQQAMGNAIKLEQQVIAQDSQLVANGLNPAQSRFDVLLAGNAITNGASFFQALNSFQPANSFFQAVSNYFSSGTWFGF
jgi:hypothetical protein